ncbi:MAG: hypothetical protein GWN58_33750 [Anaerolineae bacterium]|nr:hypothetical protein [Thermoplasmata archaeon]NIV34243.1 hypothetical protein [Anaerolineae bacterium]NIY06091.1 hypothetical protein [Thermoplasmata archaeon]
MEKNKALFFLNRLRDAEVPPVDHVAEAEAGTSYAERQRKVAESEREPSPEQQALEVAINAVEALPDDFKLPSGDRLFNEG